MKPDKDIVRVHRFLSFRSEPQAVVRGRNGHLDLVPAASKRFAAMADSPEWAPRIAGVFAPGVSLEAFRRELAA